VIPKRLRFPAAIVAARWLEPVVRRTGAYELRRQQRTDGLPEISLDLVLTTLTRHGTTFEPCVTFEGFEHLAASKGVGTLLVGPHMMLSMLVVPYLVDAGLDPLIIFAVPHLPVPGRRETARVLLPSPGLLRAVRRELINGAFVGGMIDRSEPERRTATVETSAGEILVSDALLRVAVRQGARILFIGSHLDAQSRVVLRLATPCASSASVEEILGDFARFADGRPSLGTDESEAA
jgi:hypothetical protein